MGFIDLDLLRRNSQRLKNSRQNLYKIWDWL